LRLISSVESFIFFIRINKVNSGAFNLLLSDFQ